MEIEIRKITDRDLMLEACESTFAGKSNQSLKSIYVSEHSPARTQLFWITLKDIPLYVASHLVRHHVGVEKFQLTHRTDRNGGGIDIKSLTDKMRELLDTDFQTNEEGAELRKQMEEVITTVETSTGRMTPTDLALMINAQSLIDMSKLRLCHQASTHTREVMEEIKYRMSFVDKDLCHAMVKKCVYRNGICGESKPCGFHKSPSFDSEMISYLFNNLSEYQQPLYSVLN